MKVKTSILGKYDFIINNLSKVVLCKKIQNFNISKPSYLPKEENDEICERY